MQLPSLWMQDNTKEIKYKDFMPLCISHPLPNARAISPTMQFFLFFLALFILLICWHLTLQNRICWQPHSVPAPTSNCWSAEVMLSKRSFLQVSLPSHSFKTYAIKIFLSKCELKISIITVFYWEVWGELWGRDWQMALITRHSSLRLWRCVNQEHLQNQRLAAYPLIPHLTEVYCFEQ